MKLTAQHDSGALYALVTLLETGEKLSIRFDKGEISKKVSVDFGTLQLEGEFKLVKFEAPANNPDLDLQLVLKIPSIKSVEKQTAFVEKTPVDLKEMINSGDWDTPPPPMEDFKPVPQQDLSKFEDSPQVGEEYSEKEKQEIEMDIRISNKKRKR